MGRLAGKVALITGGGTGIGAAAAELFAREGAAVAVSGRRSGPLEEVAERIRKGDGKVLALAGDMTRESDVRAVVAGVEASFGPITVLFNNHGVGENEPLLHEMNNEIWDSTLDINLRGVYLVTRAVIPGMLKAGGGSVIINSSRNALQAIKNSAAYSTSKAALLGLTRSLALDYAERGIRVNAVCPGLIPTPMTEQDVKPYLSGERPITERSPRGTLGTALEVAYAALFLASDESSLITGVALPVDGGRSIV